MEGKRRLYRPSEMQLVRGEVTDGVAGGASDRQRPRRSGALLALLRPLGSRPRAQSNHKSHPPRQHHQRSLRWASGQQVGASASWREHWRGETHFEVSRFEASKYVGVKLQSKVKFKGYPKAGYRIK